MQWGGGTHLSAPGCHSGLKSYFKRFSLAPYGAAVSCHSEQSEESISKVLLTNKDSSVTSFPQNDVKRAAFTLAEVLITLGIIGVVAAMTLPSLVANYKEKAMISQAKKGLSVVLNSLSQARVKKDVENNGEIFDSNNTSDQTADLIFENMNVVQRCKVYDNKCLKNYKIKYDKPMNDGYGNYRQPFVTTSYSRAILKDGMIIGLAQTKYPEGSCTNYYTTWDKDSNGNYILDSSGNKMNERKVKETDCGHIFFDVNGLKGPNQFGADVYLIYVTPYSYVQSIGSINNVLHYNKLQAKKYDLDGRFE